MKERYECAVDALLWLHDQQLPDVLQVAPHIEHRIPYYDMRRTLGLDLPERRISLSAHDFAENLGAPEVVLAYASRGAGAPTVISRFVQRLAAVAGEKP